MASVPAAVTPAVRSSTWKWWVCGLLLLATMLNYMDRLTLNLTAVRIMDDLCLSPKDYGRIESAFAIAFATGAIVVGWMVDRWNVWWLYPTAVAAWSAMGFVSGMAGTFAGLLAFRFLLGLTEAAHWPCALRTTQRMLAPADRPLGNSMLQSGAAIGAVITPLVVAGLVFWTDTWRYPFLVVGAIGLFWVILWMESVRREDLALQPATDGTSADGRRPSWIQREVMPLLRIWGDRRYWVLVVVVVTINVAWHYFRAWMPLFLQITHGYSEGETALFSSAYYIATDAGTLAAGFATVYLTRRGLAIHRSRLLVFLFCALLTALSVVAAILPAGWMLLAVLLVIGFGALGLFPNYYSLSQELTVQHQGKVTGTLGCTNWIAMAALHELVGESVKQTGSYSFGVAVAGLAPLIGFAALLFWGKARSATVPTTPTLDGPAATAARA